MAILARSRQLLGTIALIASFAIGGAALAQTDPLPTWNDGSAKKAIIDFVQATTTEGNPKFVALKERIATFDQDGTLWVELPDTKVGTFTQELYDEAKKKGWTIISVKSDWKQLFPSSIGRAIK